VSSLGDLASLGPFFAVDSHPVGAAPARPWRPVRELAQQQGPLPRRIASVRTALAAREGQPPGETELRVAASVAHLGLVARLVAPALGAAVTGHRVDMRLDVLWWQDTLGGPVPLSIPVPGPLAESAGSGARDTAEILPRRFLDEVIAPVTRATRELVPISNHVLWGNVTSGINAAARQAAASRPDLAGSAWQAARDSFASPLLGGERYSPGPAFRRSSCCLIYRVASGRPTAVCGDCVLNGKPARRARGATGARPPR
jgi:FhuF-like iron-sulfur protein